MLRNTQATNIVQLPHELVDLLGGHIGHCEHASIILRVLFLD